MSGISVRTIDDICFRLDRIESHLKHTRLTTNLPDQNDREADVRIAMLVELRKMNEKLDCLIDKEKKSD